MTKEEVVIKIKNEPNFAVEFRLVGDGVNNLVIRSLKEESVRRCNEIALELYIKVAFVPILVFTGKFLAPAAMISVKVVKAVLPEGGKPVEGVLMRRDGFPVDVQHYICKLSATTYTRLEEMLLSSANVLRAGQAK